MNCPHFQSDSTVSLAYRRFYWVSQLLGFSLGGMLAALLDAMGLLLESGGAIGDFIRRLIHVAI
jgi:hypothetical protein